MQHGRRPAPQSTHLNAGELRIRHDRIDGSGKVTLRHAGQTRNPQLFRDTERQASPTSPGSTRVGEAGLEPAHPFGHRNLNPARLPIPPLARGDDKRSRAFCADCLETWHCG